MWLESEWGQGMPVDSEVVFVLPSPLGDTKIVTKAGIVVRGDRIFLSEFASRDAYVGPAIAGHISHCATCPNAEKHRKGKAKK